MDREVSVPDELPKKCQECAKSEMSNIRGKCDFCHKLELHEEVLCHLNRCIQNPVNFSCHAFRPRLKLASSSINKTSDVSSCTTDNFQRKSFQKLLRSDKIKYERALTLQKLKRNPDGVFMELKYHFVWNVIHRNPVFSPNNDVLDFVHTTFWECSELAGGFISLLWIAPDHVHLYVESDGENSVETIVQKIKLASEGVLLDKLVGIKDGLDGENTIWDTAYFSETIG